MNLSELARTLVVMGFVSLAATCLGGPQDPAQPPPQVEDGIERPDPPALDDFETDANGDGVPDGWYNLRDGAIQKEGGAVGPKFLRFRCDKPGRPARLSRAFGINGSKFEAVVIGLWVRVEKIQAGERVGEEPGLMIDFLGEKLRQTTRGSLGPWNSRTFAHYGNNWTRVSRRIPVPPSTRDAIISLGLLGATGVLDVDGMTLDLIPVGGESTQNLVKNPSMELGDPDPFGWIIEGGTRRSFPGNDSPSAIELVKANARAMTGLARPVDEFQSLAVSIAATGSGLRGSGGVSAYLFFLDDDGKIVPGLETGVLVFSWSGTFGWRRDREVVPVPRAAVRAVLQIDKADGLGSIRLDDFVVTSSPGAEAGEWTPFHVDDDTALWQKMPPSTAIEPGSALDFSFLQSADPANPSRVVTKQGRLHYSDGKRARFFGVQLLAPSAFLSDERAEALADRLARSGVNLVRFGDLDAPLGPDRSLFDDTRDDTKEFDTIALGKLDHLIAALAKRGIYHAIELQGGRRFREEDRVKSPGSLPPGGGPAVLVDPTIKGKSLAAAKAFLDHVNPETGLAIKANPMLAWVTLAGEITMFDMIDTPTALPGDYLSEYRLLAGKSGVGTGRKFWQSLERAHWESMAETLRKEGLNASIASVSHWRREPEFAESLDAKGIDLIDDRIYWLSPTWVAPRHRSMLWSLDGGLLIDAARKRKVDRPYVLGQWCDYSPGVWSTPYEAAEQLLAAETAATEDWDGLVRRGLFVHPEIWGSAAPGTGGGEDIFQVPEVANAEPQVFGLWPHAASMFLRGRHGTVTAIEKGRTPARKGASKGHSIPGWTPSAGKLVIDTMFTQGVAGWPGGGPIATKDLAIEVDNTYAVIVASSATAEQLSKTKRVLISAVARVQPTGFLWVDRWKKETADPGRPPLLMEPVMGKVTWPRQGNFKAYSLDNNGARVNEARLAKTSAGFELLLEGNTASMHWELVAE